MTNTNRLVALGAAVFAIAATPAAAAPVAATPKATAKAQIVKPLTFISTANLNFGTVVLGTLPAAGSSVTIAKTSATTVAVCGTNLTCSGASQPAQYRVTATPSQPLVVRAAASNLLLQGGAATDLIVFTPDAPTSVSVPNAATSVDFVVGGAIAVPQNVKEGVYLGDMDVTVDYN